MWVRNPLHNLEPGPKAATTHKEMATGFCRTILRARPINDLHLFHSHPIGYNPVTWAQSNCKSLQHVEEYTDACQTLTISAMLFLENPSTFMKIAF